MIHLIRMCAPNETVKYDQSVTQLGFESSPSITVEILFKEVPTKRSMVVSLRRLSTPTARLRPMPAEASVCVPFFPQSCPGFHDRLAMSIHTGNADGGNTSSC